MTALAAIVPTASAQRGVLTRADSALVGRILLAEDRRDTAASAFAEGSRHGDARIQLIARRAAARVRDAQFAARDSFPAVRAAPVYPDPAWRLRFRGLTANRTNCAALGTALADSNWHVRLRAADLVGPDCARDTAIVRTLAAWASNQPRTAARARGGVSWHAAAHALVALARIAPARARAPLRAAAESGIPWLRQYAARAAGMLADTARLTELARDNDGNVQEAAVEALVRVAGHAADREYLQRLVVPHYAAVRAGARALAGSPRRSDVLDAALAASRRLRADSSETSRDARMELLRRVEEFMTPADAGAVAEYANDFDCVIADTAAAIATRLGTRTTARCTRLPVALPPDAVALALGRDVRLRVTLADSSGGGSFVVRLRGDVAPVMAARVLALARSGYYNGLTWHRVEADFVVQGGGPGANEYVGHPRFFRDELGTIAHPRGTIGMSTRGHDTGDAQWFFNLRDNARLTREYTVFAEVVEGIDVVDSILEGDVIGTIRVID
jgi:cyclophilin family peptidyl-prolyl cis-trans isomerase